MGSSIVAIVGGPHPLPIGGSLMLLPDPVLIEDVKELTSVEVADTGIVTHRYKPLSDKIRERDDKGRLIFLQKDGTRRSPFDRPFNNHKRRRR